MSFGVTGAAVCAAAATAITTHSTAPGTTPPTGILFRIHAAPFV